MYTTWSDLTWFKRLDIIFIIVSVQDLTQLINNTLTVGGQFHLYVSGAGEMASVKHVTFLD